MEHYNTGLLTVKDKWNHFASYPEKADPETPYHKIWEMPKISSYSGDGPAGLKIFLEGGEDTLANLSLYPENKRFIDLYNSGKGTVEWKAVCEEWVEMSETAGVFEKEQRIWITVDWGKAPKGVDIASVITFKSAGESHKVPISVFNPAYPKPHEIKGFVESHGYVSIEAEHYSRKTDRGGAGWDIIKGLGRSGNSVTVLPTTIPGQTEIDTDYIQHNSPVLEYDVFLFSTGDIPVSIYALPAFPVNEEYGLRVAVALDNQKPVVVSAKMESKKAIARINKMMFYANLKNSDRGQHTLKIWMVDPGVVLDKIVLETNGKLKQSYSGPPESYRN